MEGTWVHCFEETLAFPFTHVLFLTPTHTPISMRTHAHALTLMCTHTHTHTHHALCPSGPAEGAGLAQARTLQTGGDWRVCTGPTWHFPGARAGVPTRLGVRGVAGELRVLLSLRGSLDS